MDIHELLKCASAIAHIETVCMELQNLINVYPKIENNDETWAHIKHIESIQYELRDYQWEIGKFLNQYDPK